MGVKEFITKIITGFINTLKIRLIIFGISLLLLGPGLTFIGTPLPWLIALGIAVLDFLPVLGAGMVMIPWAGYKYFQGETKTAVQILVLYLIVFVGLRLLEPVFLGKTVGLPPLLTFAITTGSLILFGFWGIFLGPLFSVIAGILWEWRELNKKKYYSEKEGRKG